MKTNEVKPWIENCSLADILRARHYDPGPNSLLIQIVDPETRFPDPAWKGWATVEQFNFLDLEDGQEEGVPPDFLFSAEQADRIVRLLVDAYAKRTNVVVHCHAGLCRSGAIVEFAVSYLGFRDTERPRIPNLRVKKMLQHAIIRLESKT